MKLKSRRHQPFHLYLDNMYYFLTSHTYQNKFVLESDLDKRLLYEKVRKWFKDSGYKIFAWVILDNHYHLLFQTLKSSDLPKVISKIHSGFSYEINKLENSEGRKIWQNYWDKCIRSRKDFWRHFNYIHHNPVKHKYVKRMDDYRFSSFSYWKETKGMDWVMSTFQKYPIIDFTTQAD
ncbi:MAG: transposase [Candidatus Edwardsbacteria bacterium]